MFSRIFGFVISLWSDESDSAEKVSFNRDVHPIWSEKCSHCHGPDSDNQDSEFRLDTREHAVANFGGGICGVVAGDTRASKWVARIHRKDGDVMPPADAVRQLSEKEKETKEAWQQNPSDAFVLDSMLRFGLMPNQNAEKTKRMRRVTFDLTGLPPSTSDLAKTSDPASKPGLCCTDGVPHAVFDS